jgi:molybdopterin converting factor small subunit
MQNSITLKIDLRLYATLQPYAPPNASCYPIEAGTSIEMIIEDLAMPKDQIKLVFLNGVKCDLETQVKDGDRIGIFPPVGGG